MGLFDNILKEVGKTVDKKAKEVLGSEFKEFTGAITDALEKQAEVIGGKSDNAKDSQTSSVSNEKPAPSGADFTHPDITADGDTPIKPYRKHESRHVTFEIPENFMDFDSGALEMSECFLYTPVTVTDDNYEELCERYDIKNPVICVENVLGKKEKEAEKKSINGTLGIFDYEAFIEDNNGRVTRLYGYGEQALALIYSPDIKGTALEKKLVTIFEHTAETFRIL